MPRILKPADFIQRLAAGEDVAAIFRADQSGQRTRLAMPMGQAAANDGDGERQVRFTISTQGVKRDGMSILTAGWRIDAFLTNPVVLWAHDETTPAIGRAVGTAIDAGTLVSTAVFAERDIHPLADTIYQLIKRRFLNSASVGFCPLKARMATDPARAGEVDLLEQELWEWSVVNVPADPEALVAARRTGIDTGPIFIWTERMLDGEGLAMVPRPELEELRRMARMPAGIRDAASRLPQTNGLSQDVKDDAQKAIDAYEEKMAKNNGKTDQSAPGAKKQTRSLWHVSDLASLLYSLGYLQERVDTEAGIEGDDSQVPAQLLAALKQLGQVLVDMTVEEVNEFLSRDDGDDDITVIIGESVAYDATPARRSLEILRAVAGQARVGTGRRFVLRSTKSLTQEQWARAQERVGTWLRTPDDVLNLDPEFSLEALEPLAARANTPAGAGAPDVEALGQTIGALQRRVRVLELKLNQPAAAV